MKKKMMTNNDISVSENDSTSQSSNMITVLDKGYVRLVDHMGSDLSVVNAARASFAKESKEMSVSDTRLLSFLIRENHMSPFRHAFMTFEFKAPLMVARQHWKYVVGSDHTMDSWNESSRRYITMEPEFYIPTKDQWRTASEDKKQGSGGPVDPMTGAFFSEELISLVEKCEALYNSALDLGIAPEQARLLLPAYGMYVIYRWSCSLQSVALFLTQRLKEDAQSEIQDYAEAVYDLSCKNFPLSIPMLVGR
jgi:thymidylate synthase (FAD)